MQYGCGWVIDKSFSVCCAAMEYDGRGGVEREVKRGSRIKSRSEGH